MRYALVTVNAVVLLVALGAIVQAGSAQQVTIVTSEITVEHCILVIRKSQAGRTATARCATKDDLQAVLH